MTLRSDEREHVLGRRAGRDPHVRDVGLNDDDAQGITDLPTPLVPFGRLVVKFDGDGVRLLFAEMDDPFVPDPVHAREPELGSADTGVLDGGGQVELTQGVHPAFGVFAGTDVDALVVEGLTEGGFVDDGGGHCGVCDGGKDGVNVEERNGNMRARVDLRLCKL